MSEITRNQAIQIVEDIRTAISAGSVTNTMEAQVLEYCVSVLGRRIVEASLSGHIENLPDVAAFLAGISPSATLKALLEGITDTVEVINANIGNGYIYAGIATPSGTPVSGKVFYLAKQAGQYANFGGLTVTEGVNILKRNGSTWTQEQLLSMADIRKNPLIGYYECDTAGDTSAKTVTAAGYVLPATGGSVKIKMANRNTVANATLNINSTGAKPLYYNGRRAGVGNTWETNEIIEVFYDGAKYQAYNVAGCNGDGVFDISVHNPANGLPTPYPDLKTALGTDGEHVPQSLRKGGMSVKFIQSSDNKYVQYRLMADDWSITESDWQGVDNEPTAGSDNLVKSGGVSEKLHNKVDKEEGKALVDTQYVKEEEHDELIRAVCDSEGKILQGIKSNGRHVFNAGVEISRLKTESGIESGDWIDVKTDNEDKILEGTNKDGEKHISKFDKSTQDLIKGFAGGSVGSNYISIPMLDANFTSPVPVEITGTKGSDGAKYVFDLPLSDDDFNIRFKFRITENLLNANKSAVIASVNNANVTAVPVPLTQCVAPITFEFEGERPLVNWPTTDGGIKFNNGDITKKRCRQHLGKEAFSVKYLGENTATIENTGAAIVLTINGIATTYSFASYPTVAELYEAMSANTDIQLGFVALDRMNCSELAKFSAVTLRDTFYCDDKGTYGSHEDFDPQARIDNPPFYLRYAVSDEWHQVEIVKIGNNIYNTCDGNVEVVTNINEDNKLVLGGNCGVLFKELEIYTNTNGGAEIVNDFIISDVNPYIVIFEVHGIYNGAAYTVTSEETETYMSSMNTDTLEYIFSDLRDKGYIPVSIKDIEHYYVGNGSLPKRCYTMIFDDVRWQVCLDLECRRVFNRYGVKPALALITARSTIIEYDGNVITKQEAVNICHAAGFDIVSHTHNHRSTYGLKPSQYREWLQKDIIDADKLNVDGSVIVFPGGATDEYMSDVMEDVGIKLGIGTPGEYLLNNTLRNRFFLTRVNISRIKRADGSDYPYSTFNSRIL